MIARATATRTSRWRAWLTRSPPRRASCSARLRRCGGTSFSRELQRVRMERAAQLLRVGSMPVQDVAAAVGYRQPAQFAKAFRRHHGTPVGLSRRRRRADLAA